MVIWVYKKIFIGSWILLVFSSVLFLISLYSATASNGSLPTFQKTWTCANKDGFTEDPQYPASNYCYKEGCMSEKQLLMWQLNRPGVSRSQYDLTFSVARPGAYTCEVKVITNEFGFSCRNKDKPDCGAYCPQTNEKTDVFLNAEKVGTTEDLFCNTWDDCENGNGNGASCHQYSKDGVSVCSSHSGCCWMYGASSNEKCGGVGLCGGNVGHVCTLRICYPSGDGCKCLKEEGDAWQGGCSQWNGDAATCNDYSAHNGIVCCHDGSKCITDPCPVWYKTRVEWMYDNSDDLAGLSDQEKRAELEKQCEGRPSAIGNYQKMPNGLCEWDDDWRRGSPNNYRFPCRCESAGSKTSKNSYIKR